MKEHSPTTADPDRSSTNKEQPRVCIERRSLLPSQPLDGGSVLSLDIDGVLAPLGQSWEGEGFDLNHPPSWFGCPHDARTPLHPRMPGWMLRLMDAYTHVAWNSSWGPTAAYFGYDLLPPAAQWPTLYDWDLPLDETTHMKAQNLLDHVASDVPLAVVDDDAASWMGGYRSRKANLVELLESRSAPTLIVVPGPHVGLTAMGVEKLLQFAGNPQSFQHSLYFLYCDHAIQWDRGEGYVYDEPERGKRRTDAWVAMPTALIREIEKREDRWEIDRGHKWHTPIQQLLQSVEHELRRPS